MVFKDFVAYSMQAVLFYSICNTAQCRWKDIVTSISEQAAILTKGYSKMIYLLLLSWQMRFLLETAWDVRNLLCTSHWGSGGTGAHTSEPM